MCKNIHLNCPELWISSIGTLKPRYYLKNCAKSVDKNTNVLTVNFQVNLSLEIQNLPIFIVNC